MFCTLPLLSEVLSELSALPRELKDKAAADGVEVTLEIFPNEEGTGGREGKGRGALCFLGNFWLAEMESKCLDQAHTPVPPLL